MIAEAIRVGVEVMLFGDDMLDGQGGMQRMVQVVLVDRSFRVGMEIGRPRKARSSDEISWAWCTTARV